MLVWHAAISGNGSKGTSGLWGLPNLRQSYMYYIVPACKRPLDKSVLPLVFGGPKLWDILGTPILRYRYVLLLNPTLLLGDEDCRPSTDSGLALGD